MVANFYRGAKGIFVVYDVTNMESFLNLTSWLVEVERHTGVDVAKMIIGNKSDLSGRVVGYDQASSFAKEQGIQFLETSAKSSDNVDEAFLAMVAKIKQEEDARSLVEENLSSNSQNVNLNSVETSEMGSCWCV